MYISSNSLKCTSRMSNFIGYKLYLQKLINKNTHFASKDKVILNKNKRTRQKSVLQPHKIRVTLQACIQFRSKEAGGYQKESFMLQILKLTWTFLTLLTQRRYFPTRKVHFLSTKLMFLIMTLLCTQSKVLQRAPRAGNLCKIESEGRLGVAETCRLSTQNLRVRVDRVWE